MLIRCYWFNTIVALYGIRSIYGAPYNTRIYEVCCAFHPHIACIIALYGERVIYSAPYNTCIYDAFKSKSTVWCNNVQYWCYAYMLQV